jgi:hypothetical protein
MMIYSELEIASFETHLAQAVAKNCVKTLSMFCVKCDNLVSDLKIGKSNNYNYIKLYFYLFLLVQVTLIGTTYLCTESQ